MLLQNKKIAIVGAGPGGLTLAKLLQMKGIDTKVYERDFDKNARVQGSPLDLHDDSGLAALRKAGLLEEFKQHFMVGADRMQIMDEHARIFFSDHDEKPEEDFGHEHFRPEIDRGVLRKILLESLAPETVVWNSHFSSLEAQNGGWLLHFKNRPPEYADMVIGADGANSKIRPYITDSKAFYSGVTMLEGVIYQASKTAPKINALLRGGKIMAFGNKKDLLMGQKANGEIGFYASFKTEENWAVNSGLDYADKQQVLAWFKKEYPEWSSVWHELFESAVVPFIPRPIYCMPLDQTWEALPNLALLGDAAHVMPPFAGEGVNMAMLDALELSENLTGGQHNTMEEAIAYYETNMRKRASQSALESLENGERMHSEKALDVMLGFFSNP
ncbi:FAD-dependent oxidoreductase [Flavobacterium humi]|uniref:Flavin-dependent monooxygenase n=1 Tax=Flavobacterium humi TaxID=2562683 RepID=A0A4Z0LD56_9FLAO|nr:NAD(P)/FAD-dependent oxidoreductase [Flavobacterium humi]TGD59805.1 FAD-dependent monooxygenase [Flavobacterium humi]